MPVPAVPLGGVVGMGAGLASQSAMGLGGGGGGMGINMAAMQEEAIRKLHETTRMNINYCTK